MNRLFVTAIDTNAGKSFVSAILCEALQADYWKPVQSGSLEFTDTDSVKSLVTNNVTVFHPSAYSLTRPMSPHIAAEKDGVHIDVSAIVVPDHTNTLIIEGAGGVLAPLNNSDFVCDLAIAANAPVVLVSRHYLGSINHTLLTANELKRRSTPVAGIIFNGNEIEGTEDIIIRHTGYKVLGRIAEEEQIDRATVLKYAEQFRNILNEC